MNIDRRMEISRIARQAPSADNSQPWALNWNDSGFGIYFRNRHLSHGVFAAGSHATLLTIGAVVDHLNMVFAANNIPANWQWPADPSLGNPYVSADISDTLSGFIEPEDVMQRHTNRFAYHRTPVPATIIEETVRFREGENRIVPLAGGDPKAQFIRLVRTASEARFCTRELVEWLTDSLRFTTPEIARGDGLDIHSLSLPPGGRLFMRFISDWRRMRLLNLVGAYKIMALSEIALLSASPALLCIVGPLDALSVIAAGRLMARLWIYLNSKGLAVHPYYVVSDQLTRLRAGKVTSGFESKIRDVNEQTRLSLGLSSSETLHIFFRVGYPKKQPVRSKRLPLEAVSENPLPA